MAGFGVCMVSTYFPPFVGGAERQIELLSNWLTNNDVPVMVVTRSLPDAPHYEIIDGVEVWRVQTLPGKIGAAISFIVMACWVIFRKRKKFDVIHSHQIFSPTTIGLITSFLLRKPLVVNLHGGGKRGDLGRLLRNKQMGQFRLNLIAKRASAFISISQEISQELSDAGIPKTQIHLLPNSVDSDKFHPIPSDEKQALRTTLNLPADVPLVIFVGRLVAGKGLEVLFDAWSEIGQQAQLIIIGTGELEDSLRTQASQVFPETVHLLGFKNNVVDYLQACDIWILPSFSEGLPISLLEAMACAMPIVSTSVGAIPDVIEDGVSGWLIDADDKDALVDALSEAVVLDESVIKRGKAARETILARYSADISARAYYDLYQEIPTMQN